MLLKQFEISEQMYDPINHMTQMELMDKFNLAFYEGQNLSKTDILRSFEPNFSIDYDTTSTTTTTTGSGESPLLHDDQISEKFLVDYLTDGDTPTSTTNFDFDDLDRDFDVHFSPRREARVSECTEDNFDAETFLTDDNNDQFSDVFDATAMARHEEVDLSRDLLENFDLADICDSLSNHSFDFNDVTYDIYDFDGRRQDDALPPISTLTKSNVEFNGFIRNVAPNDLQHRVQEARVKNEFGHLIRNQCTNNNVSSSLDFLQESEISSSSITNENLLVLRQDEALSRRDDPFFNSTNNSSNSDDLDDVPAYYLAECEEVSSMALICKWENCYQIYECQNSLVKHIEKCHVELKRGDEFICFWANCPRQVKPFNARYKLLIHMRVHSGEKPNKCPFKGCNKAFSRLENLKIHQRSHTGERPYLCQFSSCTKSFSNSSDRAKHQRTHFDTKPYACQVVGCLKKYTDPSSLRKHVKNHTFEEQLQIKKKQPHDDGPYYTNPTYTKQFLDPQKQKAIKNMQNFTKLEHSYSNVHENERKSIESSNIKQDLKNKISLRHKLLKNLG